MTVQSKPIPSGRRQRIGFIRPGQIERAFVVLLYLALLVLVVLSVLGTFYGRLGQDAPITAPLHVLADVQVSLGAFALAAAIQAALTVTQYGARQFAKHDRRWWMLYLVALGISVYYNVQAYWTPLAELIPGYAAGALILAGDVVPEFLAVRRE